MCSEFSSKYTIQSKLGEGSFSEVLKCKNLRTGEFVAVKKLKRQFEDFSDIKYLSELMALLKLSEHTNVLTLLEYIFDPTDGKLYLVFEVMDMSLFDLIQSHTRCLPESKVKHMFYQILNGVDHLHSNGILHRDIKPENILVKKSVVKLGDLGSVRRIQNKPPYTDYISTRWYRAPECILSVGYYGAKADVWACGCVFYEMLTSKPIFPGETEFDQLNKIHQVTGTPNTRVITKINRSNARVIEVKFTIFPAANVTMLLPFTSEGGREIFKRMLVYNPDMRTNIRRLLEHRYFSDLREKYYIKQLSEPTRANTLPQISNNSRILKNNKSCNSLQTVKLNQKEIINIEQKETGNKLSRNSWAPSSGTAKCVLKYMKSRGSNQIVTNTRQNYHPSNLTALKKRINTDKLEVQSSLKDNKSKKSECTKRRLPTIGPKPMLGSRDQVGEICWKTLSKEILPPITEL